MPYSDAFPKEKAAAIKAIALDEALPEGHLRLAYAAMNLDWDWATEGKELKRALELIQTLADVRWLLQLSGTYGPHLQKHFEMQVALQRDPISNRGFQTSALLYDYARQYDQALLQMQRASALQHEPAELIYALAVIYVEEGSMRRRFSSFRSGRSTPCPGPYGERVRSHGTRGGSARDDLRTAKARAKHRHRKIRNRIGLCRAGEKG